MKINETNHFRAALKDFIQLRQQNQIPPQMLVKLDYLLHKIYPNKDSLAKQFSQKSSIELPELPEYEKNSLDQISRETGIQLFINIINCLSGKDTVLYVRDQKMYLRKDQTLSMWSMLYLTVDSNQVVLLKKQSLESKKQKPSYTFSLQQLRISKNFKQYKKKSVFGVCYKNKNSFLIGFDQESACARVHQLLRSLVKDKLRKLKLKKIENGEKESLQDSRVTYNGNYNRQSFEQTQNQSVEQKRQRNIPKQSSFSQQNQDDQNNKYFQNNQNNQHQEAVLQYIKKQQLLSQQSFKIYRNQGNIRQMVHTKYPNIIKTFVILDTQNFSKSTKSSHYAELIMEAYLQQNQWNSQIEQLHIITKLSDNLYSVRLQTKKYSYLSWPRACKVFAMGLSLSNGVKYLVLRASDDDSDLPSQAVNMEWNQIIQIRESQKKILLTILSELDFKGYSSLQDSQKMGLKLMKSLQNFNKYIETQTLFKKQHYIFNLQKPIDKAKNKANGNMFKKKQHLQVASQQRHRKLSNQSQYSLPDDLNQSKSNINKQQLLQDQFESANKQQQSIQNNINEKNTEIEQFLSCKLKGDHQIPTQMLVNAIRKKVYERFYVKHYFDQSINTQTGKLLQVQGKNSYLSQGGIYTVNQNTGDVIFYDEKTIQLQKDVIKMIVKQLGSNLISGKSIMNMSLPVQIFDSRAILERVAMGFGYAPIYLPQAGQTTNIVKQAELVTLTIMSILPLHLNVTKPFNPILGQTFEGIVGGIPISLQQISHHPPISAIYMKGENFIIHGAFHSHAQMGLNQVTGRNLCPLYIEFPKTNTFYEVKMGNMQLTGIMYGDRIYRGGGKCFIHERTNNIFVQYSYGKDKKNVYQTAKGEKLNLNTMIGGIYTVNQKMGKKFRNCQNKKKFDGLKADDIIQRHTFIKGHWALDLYFNDKLVKTMKDPAPYKLEYPQYCLPSDSNFRLDLIYKKMGELKKSNEQKQVLENIQRNDRKLREKAK